MKTEPFSFWGWPGQMLTSRRFRKWRERCWPNNAKTVAGGSSPRWKAMRTQPAKRWWRYIRLAGCPAEWRALLRFLFVEPGGMGRLLLPYLRYYRPGFHPSEIELQATVLPGGDIQSPDLGRFVDSLAFYKIDGATELQSTK